MTIWMMFWISFPSGLLIGLCLGYFRLAQWYQQKTGRNLWEEVTKAKVSVDSEILHIGFFDAVICTRLPIEQAYARINLESPTGTTHGWRFDGKKKNQSPCPDFQGKTHYRLFC